MTEERRQIGGKAGSRALAEQIHREQTDHRSA